VYRYNKIKKQSTWLALDLENLQDPAAKNGPLSTMGNDRSSLDLIGNEAFPRAILQ
jgi:hypothetical protein